MIRNKEGVIKMSKDPRESRDRGFVDGSRSKESDKNSDVASKLLNDAISNPYKGDKDNPESYREGFRQGRK